MDVKGRQLFNTHWPFYLFIPFLTFFAPAIAKHVAHNSEVLTNHSALLLPKFQLEELLKMYRNVVALPVCVCTSSTGICLAAGSQTNSQTVMSASAMEAVCLRERIRRFLFCRVLATVFIWHLLICHATPVYSLMSRHVMTNPSSLRYPTALPKNGKAWWRYCFHRTSTLSVHPKSTDKMEIGWY